MFSFNCNITPTHIKEGSDAFVKIYREVNRKDNTSDIVALLNNALTAYNNSYSSSMPDFSSYFKTYSINNIEPSTKNESVNESNGKEEAKEEKIEVNINANDFKDKIKTCVSKMEEEFKTPPKSISDIFSIFDSAIKVFVPEKKEDNKEESKEEEPKIDKDVADLLKEFESPSSSSNDVIEDVKDKDDQ